MDKIQKNHKIHKNLQNSRNSQKNHKFFNFFIFNFQQSKSHVEHILLSKRLDFQARSQIKKRQTKR